MSGTLIGNRQISLAGAENSQAIDPRVELSWIRDATCEIASNDGVTEGEACAGVGDVSSGLEPLRTALMSAKGTRLRLRWMHLPRCTHGTSGV